MKLDFDEYRLKLYSDEVLIRIHILMIKVFRENFTIKYFRGLNVESFHQRDNQSVDRNAQCTNLSFIDLLLGGFLSWVITSVEITFCFSSFSFPVNSIGYILK